MPVSFGTVQVVPPANDSAPAGGAESAAPAKSAAPPPDPRDLGPALCQLRERAARVHAH